MRILPFFFIATFAFSNNLDQIYKTQAKLEEDRLKSIESQKENSNIILTPKKNQISAIIPNEKPCFIINEILLIGEGSDKFKQYLKKASKNVNFKKGSCLGKNSINTIYSAFYNEILKSGFITTTINLPSQNLRGVNLNALNLMGFNEIWYSSYSKNIFKADKQSVENDTKRG
jgi:putative hemolysin activation protein hecB